MFHSEDVSVAAPPGEINGIAAVRLLEISSRKEKYSKTLVPSVDFRLVGQPRCHCCYVFV